MVSKKQKNHKEVKKAYKNLFASCIEVKNIEKQIKDLKSKSNKLCKEFDEKEDKLNNNSQKISDDFLERLPLYNLHNFQLFEAGKKIDYPIKFIKDRIKTDRDLYKNAEELDSLEDKIDLLKIELLQAKINHLTKDLKNV